MFGFGRLDGSSNIFFVRSNIEEIRLFIHQVNTRPCLGARAKPQDQFCAALTDRTRGETSNEFTLILPRCRQHHSVSSLRSRLQSRQQLRGENKRRTETKECGTAQGPGCAAGALHTTRHAINFRESCTGPDTALPLPSPVPNVATGLQRNHSHTTLQLCLGHTFPIRPMFRHTDPRAKQFYDSRTL